MMKENTNVRLIDIRSTQEFLFVGHPVGALHIPWLDEPDWVPNAAFVDQVRSVMSEVEGDSQPPLMLICRSGERSNEVGQLLSGAGLVNIFSVTDGFEGPLNQNNHRSQLAGWRSEGLPWEQC